MICLSSLPPAFPTQSRPLSRAFATAALLASVAWFPAARADALAPPPIDIFFDVVGERLTDANAGEANAPRKMQIAGVPVRVDASEGDAEADRRMTAGASGRYALQFADALSMVGRAKIAGTDFIDEETPAAAVASAGADFRYAGGGWKFGLKPGFEAVHEETGFAQRDSLVEGRALKAIADGLSVAATGRYRWRQTTEGEAQGREIASARLGLASQLSQDVRMDLAYVGRQEIVEAGLDYGQPSVIRNLGPSVALALSLNRAIDVSATYEFTERSSYEAADGQPGWLSQEQHRLNLALTWALGGDPDAMQLSAGYRFENISASAADEAGDRHAGTVNFAVFF